MKAIWSIRIFGKNHPIIAKIPRISYSFAINIPSCLQQDMVNYLKRLKLGLKYVSLFAGFTLHATSVYCSRQQCCYRDPEDKPVRRDRKFKKLYMHIYQLICLPFCLSGCLSFCLAVCLFVFVCVHMYMHLQRWQYRATYISHTFVLVA